MAAYNFPNSPSNGDTVTVNGATYTYNSSKGRWASSVEGLALTDFSVTTNSAGTAALTYSNSTGVFSYTPPDLSSYAPLAATVYALTGTDIDPANGGIQTKTVAANTTFTESLTSGESVVLMLDAGASYTITWPTITWVTSAGNTAPTLTANDTLVLWKVSTTLYGAYVGSYA
jgi:hypothetical protein